VANQPPVLSYGGKTDQGLVRSDNQDFFGKFPEDNLDITTPKGQLFIVADGMGGHRGGREASMIAVKTVSESYFADESGNIAESLERAFHNANKAIYEYSTVHPGFQNMGTTCTALVLQGGRGYIAHVGDTRVYRLSKGTIAQLTDDHSSVAEMRRRGMLTEEEAKYHPERSILYRAVGIQQEVSVDIIPDVQFGSKDVFLLCTDGLHGLVEDEELLRLAQSFPPEEACAKLIALANDRGGYDNITVEIVKIEGSNSFLTQLFR
jgi:serine/threonine protein phosphatase PrpC